MGTNCCRRRFRGAPRHRFADCTRILISSDAHCASRARGDHWVNDRQCRPTSGSGKSSPRRRPGWRSLWVAVLLASPVAALAQLALTTGADTQYEYNSNVFALQKGSRTPFVGGTNFGDTDLSYGGELDAS